MKILITGAKGFVGRNLVAGLRCSNTPEHEIMEYDLDTGDVLLDHFCKEADFVFHFAGVNRPKDPGEYMAGNRDFTAQLLSLLRKHRNRCPVLFASSIQACEPTQYGKSKLAAEELLLTYGRETGAKILIYRFSNLFGKWCRPNYNSVVATFCHNVARGLPIRVDDPSTRLQLVYIDDLVEEMIAALTGNPHQCEEADFCCVPVEHQVTLGEVADLLTGFNQQPKTLMLPQIPSGSFEKKLYATYLSYLPVEAVRFPLTVRTDHRGSFAELLKTHHHGQISVNITKPGVVKGEHWHQSKAEIFVVVSGHGLIQMRQLGSDAVLEFEVSGDHPEAVQILPGYAHNIINLSRDSDLITLMWASECFDAARPDTYDEKV